MPNLGRATEGKGKRFVTRSIPQRGFSLPLGLRSPLKRNPARSALPGDFSSLALPLFAGILNGVKNLKGAAAIPGFLIGLAER